MTDDARVVARHAEVRLNDAGSLDEVVGRGVDAHMENLDTGHWFIEIGNVAVWLHSLKPIVASYEYRDPPDTVLNGHLPKCHYRADSEAPICPKCGGDVRRPLPPDVPPKMEYPRAVGNWTPGPSVERHFESFAVPPTAPERLFLVQLREAAEHGVGYGWMQQIIEWEWNHRSPGAWGPELHEAEMEPLERFRDALEDECQWLAERREEALASDYGGLAVSFEDRRAILSYALHRDKPDSAPEGRSP